MVKELTTEQINRVAVRNLAKEISMIDDKQIRAFVSQAIHAAPGRYWLRPAGNHPGHHPDDEHGDWGNLIHVKRVIIIAEMLSETESFNYLYRDILYAGLLIHDLGKYDVHGLSTSTVPEHPLLVREVVKDIKPCSFLGLMLGVAEAHMGRWGISWPKTMNEKIGHYADYIASRTTVHIPVELSV